MSTFISKIARERGLKLVDASNPLIFKVKHRDILYGKRMNHRECGFALACKRSLKVKAAYFFRGTAYLENEHALVRYILPPSMQKEIVAFDRSGAMAAGEYQLSPPTRSHTMSEVKKRSAKRKGRHRPAGTEIKRSLVHRTTGVRGLI